MAIKKPIHLYANGELELTKSSDTVDVQLSNLTEDTSPDLDADFVLSYDADASTQKKIKLTNLLEPATVGVKSGFDQSYFTRGSPYIEGSSGTPKVVSQWPFPGTASTIPTKFKVITSRNGSSGTATVEVYDVTNANVIASINYTASAITIRSTTSINNLPIGEAIFEFRIYKSGGSKVRVHSVSLR